MDDEMDLQQSICRFFRTQIQFGAYQYKETLPAMEETCRQFHISLDTVRPAYHRLQQEGYISLSKKAGAKVIVNYGQKELEQHMQSFFAMRKTAFFDLCSSLWPLFGQIQMSALKQASLTTLDAMEQSGALSSPLSYAVWAHLDLKYGGLGNEVMIRLVRYLYLFFLGPFLGAVDKKGSQENFLLHVRTVSELSRKQEWSRLSSVLNNAYMELSNALFQFYQERILIPPAGEEFSFCWNAFKKTSQLRYSLAMEFLTEISWGIYPAGSYLPTAERISIEKGVSVSTARRAVCLLNSIGAVKSSRPLGARVLSPEKAMENCDFTQPDIRRRLLDLMESLQIFALSGRAVSELTLSSLDEDTLRRWKQQLRKLKSRERCELVTYVSLEMISNYAPCHAIRTVYSELLRLLFWANPLRAMRGRPDKVNQFFLPYYERMMHALEGMDTSSFSAALETLLLYELQIMVVELKQLGIRDADPVLLPSLPQLPIIF